VATGTNNGISTPEKSTPVFLDYDQKALDAAYNQAAYAPNREQLIKRRINDSETSGPGLCCSFAAFEAR
jgi:hypothetical protein